MAGGGTACAASEQRQETVIDGTSSGLRGNKLDHVERRFEMRDREGSAASGCRRSARPRRPGRARGRGHIACARVSSPSTSVPRKTRRSGVVGEEQADRALRAGQLGEALQLLLLAGSGSRRRGRRHNRACPRLCAPSLIVAAVIVGRWGSAPAAERRVGLEQRAFARDLGGMAAGAGLVERLDERRAPLAQPLAVVLGGDAAPVGAWAWAVSARGQCGRACDVAARRA